MSQTRLPTISDPLAQIANLAINPTIKEEPNVKLEIKNVIEVKPPEPVTSKTVFGKELKKGVKADEIVIDEAIELPLETAGQGKRGKDKKKRKKKVMSEAQLAALAKGRAKSLEKRQAKAKSKKNPTVTQPPEMPKPTPAEKLDYSTFSNYMNMYEDSKRKKHSTSTQPHPNKVINERHRPTPPRSKPQPIPQPKAPEMMRWNGNVSAYASHKRSKQSRWNYGI